MQNDFEKQVRTKLDEMQLHPSAPVWNNIQKEIRGKTDRRKVLAWLLFAALLIGGSGAVYYFSAGKKSEVAQLPSKRENAASTTAPVQQPAGHQSNEQQEEKMNPDIFPEEVPVAGNQTAEKRATVLLEEIQDHITQSKTGVEDVPVSPVIQEKPQQENLAVSKAAPVVPQKSSADSEVVKADTVAANTTLHSDTLVVMAPDLKMDSILQGKLSEATPKKWSMAIVAGAGVARLVSGIGSQEKSAPSNYSPGSGPVFGSLPPSPIEDGLSFSVGTFWQKQVGQKFFIEAGIGYQVYTSSLRTGQPVRRDTTIASGNNSVSLDRYYLNTAAPVNKYTNYYHFASVPFSVQWQITKRLPLRLVSGLTLQQLVYTNALVYDQGLQIYYKDNDAFNKTQLMWNTGIVYQPGRFQINPFLEYGLTRTQKNNSGSHFFITGLKAGMFLK